MTIALSALTVLTAVVLLVVLIGGGDDDSTSDRVERGENAPAADEDSRQAEAETPAAADRAEVAKQERRAGTKAVEDAYDKLDDASNEWFVQPDADVRAALKSARDDPTLAAFCDLMSRRAQQQSADYGRRSIGVLEVKKWNCPMGVSLVLRRINQTGEYRPLSRVKIVNLNAEGNKATATISLGKGPLQSVPMVREDGAWKIAATTPADAN